MIVVEVSSGFLCLEIGIKIIIGLKAAQFLNEKRFGYISKPLLFSDYNLDQFCVLLAKYFTNLLMLIRS